MKHYSTILFDLDGTLTDPGLGITNSVAYALNKFGIEVPDRTALYQFIGPPLRDSFMEYYGFSPEQAEDAIATYREYFSVEGLFENEVYPGIPELLARLKASGKTLIVATSKPEEFSRRILEHFGLLDFFTFVAGATMDGSRGTKIQVMEHAISTCGVDVSDAVMIGDRKFDILGAKHFGLASVGVLFGYGSREELTEAGADALAESVEELTSLFTE